jgi:hypothetical protein
VDEQQRERARTLTVEAVLEMRAAYLRTPACNALKHWDQLQDRMRAAARSTETPEEWLTSMTRSLSLGAPQANSSRSFRDLADFIREHRAAREWLDIIEREYGYIIAVARGVAEQRREASGHA